MKLNCKILIGAVTAALIGLVGYVLVQEVQKRVSSDETVCEDGGVIDRSTEDVPKKIASEKIVSFRCVYSRLADVDCDASACCVYDFRAELLDGIVRCSVQWYDRQGSGDDFAFERDPSFLTLLQQVVADYEFCTYNGLYHAVSGLPDMYGADLSVVYASGETIDAYDNETCFLPSDAAEALSDLFFENRP